MFELEITLVYFNRDNGFVIGRLEFKGFEDFTTSLAAHVTDWIALLWTLTHAPQTFMKVTIQNERILNQC